MLINFHELVCAVQALKPGERLSLPDIELQLLRDVPQGLFETRPMHERVLESVVGSSFEYGVELDLWGHTVSFYRLAEPLTDGRRTFVEADRRDWFVPGPDGFYHPRVGAA